jgi:hypothetical protein
MARFETCAPLLAHVDEPESHMRKFLLCFVSTCPLAVSQTPLQKKQVPPPFSKTSERGEMTGDEIVQEIKPEQSSRCDLYDVIIQDAYIDMNWTENLNDKVIEARDYSLKETADIPSLQSRHVPGHGTENASEDGSENGLDDELVDDLEEGPGDDMDCQQTRLVMTAFEEFAKPIGSPGRLEFSDIKPTQQPLDKLVL